MIVFRKLGWLLWKEIVEIKAITLWAITTFHMVSSYYALSFAQEEHLRDTSDFIYFYFTTATTVGYGDLSPQSELGRAITVYWIFPWALSIYMILLAQVMQLATSHWRKRMDGFGNFEKEKGRTVILGLIPNTTQRIIKDLLAAGLSRDELILIAREKPYFDHDGIDFVLTEDLASTPDLVRAGVEHAKNILVMASTDDATFTAAVAVSHIAKTARIVASVECETRGELLRTLADVIPVVSQSPEVVASEVVDPGIAQVLSALGSAASNATAFSFNPSTGPLTAGVAYAAFRQLGMTFLGVQCPDQGMRLNPLDDEDVTGMYLFYISHERVNENAFRGAVSNQSKQI